MRAYVLLFMALVFGMIIFITYTGMESVLAALEFGGEGTIDEPLGSAMEMIRAVRGSSTDPQVRSTLDEVGTLLDGARSKVSQRSILRERIYERLAWNLLSVGFICLVALLAIWLALYRLLLRPLRSVVQALSLAPQADWTASVPVRGFGEIRSLQSSLNTMMSEIRLSHDRLRTMERMSVARFMAHQIKNALTPIRLCACNISDIASDKDILANAELVISETDRIERIIEQFRVLSQFPELNKSAVEVNTLLERLLGPLAMVRYYPPAERHRTVEADVVLLAEAVMNLVQNAIESGSAEPVTVTFENGPPALLRVEDRGCGMDRDTLSRAFDEHFTTKRKGMGIGLAFVKKVMDAHGFPIRMRSEPDQGTTVEVVFRDG